MPRGVGVREYNPRMPVTKRLFDLVLAAIALLAASPLMLATAILVLVTLGPPVIFRQMRPGKREKPFFIYKFRTMASAVDTEGRPLPDEKRLSGLGRLMRSLSIDELPELLNVLRGEMSWVGPRPLLMEYLPLYSPLQARRHEVVPGITGWAQINGRNARDWQTRLALDVWYVDHWSFWLDLKILAITIWKVLTREGISQPGRATVDNFDGRN